MVSALILGCALGVAGAEPDAVQPPDLAAYQAAKATAGRDADAHVALALWCEAHGMAAEKAKHLARAVLIDPSNAKARGLLGYVRRDGRWMRTDEVSKAVEESPEAQALFREYQQRRIKARDTADDQYKLARWCDEHGLDQQATAHYHRVVELDPGRDLAWKHLGFKKADGRWVKPEVEAARKAEADAQEKADKYWKPRLEKLKAALSGNVKAKKAEALEEIAKIGDSRAVPMVWAVFARRGEQSQRIALQVFRQIDAPGASQALAMLAMFSPSAGVRSEASQALTRRDPREFSRFLVMLLRDEVKYKKQNVAGPGSQGALLVEGKDVNVQRLYTPLQQPTFMPVGWTRIDQAGKVVMDYSLIMSAPYVNMSSLKGEPGVNIAAQGRNRFAAFQSVPMPADLRNRINQYMTESSNPIPVDASYSPYGAVFSVEALNAELTKNGSAADIARLGGPNFRHVYENHLVIPVQRMMEEAQYSALVAQRQLAQDVQQIDSHNAPIREVNERARGILASVAGRDLGEDRDEWIGWLYDLEGIGVVAKSTSSPTPPTIIEPVPLAYQPQVGPFLRPELVGYMPSGVSCFAGGTLVHTLRGARPIEEIRAGDLLLSQDTTTGKLDYRPVVTVFHNPPNTTYRIDLRGETVFPTGFHRFWKSGHGWVMARELKAGDRLRTVGGTVEVVSIAKDHRVQPVFNLLLEGGDDFCVGRQGVIAHDNALPDPVEHPFDGVPALADLGATSKP